MIRRTTMKPLIWALALGVVSMTTSASGQTYECCYDCAAGDCEVTFGATSGYDCRFKYDMMEGRNGPSGACEDLSNLQPINYDCCNVCENGQCTDNLSGSEIVKEYCLEIQGFAYASANGVCENLREVTCCDDCSNGSNCNSGIVVDNDAKCLTEHGKRFAWDPTQSSCISLVPSDKDYVCCSSCTGSGTCSGGLNDLGYLFAVNDPQECNDAPELKGGILDLSTLQCAYPIKCCEEGCTAHCTLEDVQDSEECWTVHNKAFAFEVLGPEGHQCNNVAPFHCCPDSTCDETQCDGFVATKEACFTGSAMPFAFDSNAGGCVASANFHCCDSSACDSCGDGYTNGIRECFTDKGYPFNGQPYALDLLSGIDNDCKPAALFECCEKECGTCNGIYVDNARLCFDDHGLPYSKELTGANAGTCAPQALFECCNVDCSSCNGVFKGNNDLLSSCYDAATNTNPSVKDLQYGDACTYAMQFQCCTDSDCSNCAVYADQDAFNCFDISPVYGYAIDRGSHPEPNECVSAADFQCCNACDDCVDVYKAFAYDCLSFDGSTSYPLALDLINNKQCVLTDTAQCCSDANTPVAQSAESVEECGTDYQYTHARTSATAAVCTPTGYQVPTDGGGDGNGDGVNNGGTVDGPPDPNTGGDGGGTGGDGDGGNSNPDGDGGGNGDGGGDGNPGGDGDGTPGGDGDGNPGGDGDGNPGGDGDGNPGGDGNGGAGGDGDGGNTDPDGTGGGDGDGGDGNGGSPGDGAGGETAGAFDDPHFLTWSHVFYDFMGACDLILLRAPHFSRLFELAIHIRTTIRYDYSYIENAVVQIGNHTLEVASYGEYFLDGVSSAHMPAMIAGYTLEHFNPSKNIHIFEIKLDGDDEKIVVKSFKDMVAVKVQNAHASRYHGSQGMLGVFETGAMVDRAGTTVIADPNAFAREWQVRDTEPMLFQTVRAPQYPQDCELPLPKAISLRSGRRLQEAAVTRTEAEDACSGWPKETIEACIHDVLATKDLELAAAGLF